MSTKPKVLLVDDEPDILEILSYNLGSEDYIVETASSGPEALEKLVSFNPDLMILDVMMPEMDGIEVCTKIRESKLGKDNLMIAFLTARNESFAQISALDSGGDDYITKPIKPNVLKSRIRALFRRHPDFTQATVTEKQEFGDLIIDHLEYKVISNGAEYPLAKKEFELLVLLSSKPGKVFKRAEILSKVWGNEVIVGDRTIDVHIRKLREKIGSKYIQTMKGVGYKFKF